MQVFQPGDVPVPGYKLFAFLGKGSYGEVWKASGPGGVECALKFIALDNKGGLKEFRAIGRVKRFRHPNLVPIMAVWLRDAHGNTMGDNDAGESISVQMGGDKSLVLAMGLGEKSLLDLLADARTKSAVDALPGGLSLKKLLKYTQDAAAGIDYLNIRDPDRGGNGAVEIVHCDIKPGNLLLVGGGVQVCDYGVAKALDRSPGQDARTTMAAGTAAYAAPELINNEPGEWTDQYCLAITYYELRTGQLPFPEHRALQAHLLNKLDFSRVQPDEQEVLRRATAMQPDRRFGTCGEFVEALFVATQVTLHGGSGVLKVPADRPSGVPGTAPLPPPDARVSDLPLLTPAPPSASRTLSDLLVKDGELVPDHTLIRPIGQGGYGQVWEARDKHDEPCALKVVRDLKGRGKQELVVLDQMRGLKHPNLLEVQDSWVLGPDLKPIRKGVLSTGSGGLTPQAVVIRTPLAESNLRKRLDQCQQDGQPGIPLAELVRHLRGAADAIDHLNWEGQMVHRDIKPENLLLKDGRVLVSDFGLAKLVDRDGTVPQSTGSGMTLDYAPPEILRHKTVTTQSDQYSLAVTYHVLRTGRLPFPVGLSMVNLLEARTTSRLDLSALPADEQKVLRRALSANPNDRWPSCRVMADALEKILHPVPVPPDDPPSDDYTPPIALNPGETIGVGTDLLKPKGKTERPGGDTTPNGLPTGKKPPALPGFGQPVPPPKKKRKWKKLAMTAGVLTAMVALGGLTVYFWPKPDPNAGLVQKVERAIAANDFATAAADLDKLAPLNRPQAERLGARLAEQKVTRIGELREAALASARSNNSTDADKSVQQVAELDRSRADALRNEVAGVLAENRRLKIDKLCQEASVHARNADRETAAAVVQQVAALDQGRAATLQQEVTDVLAEFDRRATEADNLLKASKFDDARREAAALPAKHPRRDGLLTAINKEHGDQLEGEFNALVNDPKKTDKAKELIAKVGEFDKDRADKLTNRLPASTGSTGPITQKPKDPMNPGGTTGGEPSTPVKGVTDLIADARTEWYGRWKDRTKPPPPLAQQLNPAVETWAEKMRSAWVAATPLFEPAGETPSPAKLIEQYAAVKVAGEQLAALPDGKDDKEAWDRAVQPALAKRVTAVIPKLDANTKWDELAKVCEAAEQTANVKACRLECWIKQGRAEKQPDGPDASALVPGQYPYYVQARVAESAAELAKAVPAAAADWFTPTRAAETRDLLHEAATDRTHWTGRPPRLTEKPFAADKAGEAYQWLTAADRAGELSAGDDGVPADKRRQTRYFRLLAWWSADEPTRVAHRAAVAAVADGLAAKPELDALALRVMDRARFRLACASTRGAESADRAKALGDLRAVLDLAQPRDSQVALDELYPEVIEPLATASKRATWTGLSADTRPADADRQAVADAAADVLNQAGRHLLWREKAWTDAGQLDKDGGVRSVAVKLFAAAAALGDRPEDHAWAALAQPYETANYKTPKAEELTAGNSDVPAVRLLKAFQTHNDLADLADYRKAITAAKADSDRFREELGEAYKWCGRQAIKKANGIGLSQPAGDPGRDKAVRELLEEAIGYGDKLVAVADDPLVGLDIRGCGEEDLAWLFKVRAETAERISPKGWYALAEATFNKALPREGGLLGLVSAQAQARVNRGRNLVKWAEDKFQNGPTRSPAGPPDQRFDRLLARAEAEFQKVFDTPDKDVHPDFAAEAHTWAAEAAMLRYEDARRNNRDDRCGDLFEQAVKHYLAAGRYDTKYAKNYAARKYEAALIREGERSAGNPAGLEKVATRLDELAARKFGVVAVTEAQAAVCKAEAIRFRAAAKNVPVVWDDDLKRLAAAAPQGVPDRASRVRLMTRWANVLRRQASAADPKNPDPATLRAALAVAEPASQLAPDLLDPVDRAAADGAFGAILYLLWYTGDKDAANRLGVADGALRRAVELAPDHPAAWLWWADLLDLDYEYHKVEKETRAKADFLSRTGIGLLAALDQARLNRPAMRIDGEDKLYNARVTGAAKKMIESVSTPLTKLIADDLNAPNRPLWVMTNDQLDAYTKGRDLTAPAAAAIAVVEKVADGPDSRLRQTARTLLDRLR